jgi:hypothetical protein
MSQSSNSTSMFRTFLKWGGITILLMAAVWTSVIIWWQSTHRVISVNDVLLYLVALPLVLLAAVVTIRLVQRRTQKKSSAFQDTTQGPTHGDKSEGSDRTFSEKRATLPIVGTWVVTSIATSPGEFLKALSEKRSRPRPDMQLLDARGFPIPSGRVMDLEIDPIRSFLTRIASKNAMNNVPDHDEWRDAFLRTLALLDQVVDQAINEWPVEFETTDVVNASQPVGTLRGSTPSHSRLEKPLSLQIKLLIPADFRPHEKQLALAYLFEKITVLRIPAEHVHIEVLSASDDITALAVLDRFNVQTHRDGASEALLLLAAYSSLCYTVLDDWQSSGQLFSSHCPSGLMLGEAAFGVLCISNKALEFSTVPPKCRLSRVSAGKRESSADLPGKPSYVCLAETVNEAFASAEISGEKIAAVASDADHRTNRVLECIGAMLNATPQLDAVENRLAVNEACGHLGAASMLGALVAGAVKAGEEGDPVLLFNVSHMMDRAAAILLQQREISLSS